MSLLDAPKYDATKERRRIIGAIVLIVIVLAGIFAAWKYRNFPEEHTVSKFLNAVVAKDYDKAFAIWNADPEWKQHSDRYANYTRGQFELDWGPAGDYGEIKSFAIAGSVTTPEKTGVVVAVRLNDRAEPVALIVNRKTKQIGFSPVGVRVNTF